MDGRQDPQGDLPNFSSKGTGTGYGEPTLSSISDVLGFDLFFGLSLLLPTYIANVLIFLSVGRFWTNSTGQASVPRKGLPETS